MRASLREREQDEVGERALPQAPEERADGGDAAAQSAAPDETGAAISQAEGADLHLEVSVERLERFRDIAAHVGMSVETWAAHTLDSASRRPGA